MKISLLSRPELIRNYLMNLIYSNREVEAMIPSERELCRQFKVTRPTVRLAIKGLIREGALEIRPGLGTFIIRRMHNTDEFGRPYRNVAILTGDGRQVAVDRFFWEIYAAAGTELVRSNVTIRPGLLLGGSREELLVELGRLKVDGVVWISPPELEYPRVLEEMGVPVICINRGMDDSGISCVWQDMEQAGRDCGRRLLERNRRNVLLIRAPRSFSGRLFHAGLTAAFATAKVPFSGHLTMEELPGWQDKLKLLLECRTPIDAIYADSQLVSDVLKVIRASGAVSTPCLISGKHRLELLSDFSHCMMLDMPLETLGKTAARRLLDRLEGAVTGRVCECLPIPIVDYPEP